MTDEERAKARAARAAYQREWRRKNPEKHKGYVENYWAKKAREMEVQKDALDQSDSERTRPRTD